MSPIGKNKSGGAHELQIYLQGSRQMTNFSRRYYERELGAVMGLDPGGQESLTGYSEPFRRFVQREQLLAQANEIPNPMPSWLPGDDYFLSFRTADGPRSTRRVS